VIYGTRRTTGELREQAVEIANEFLKESGAEGVTIATGLKLAREHFANEKKAKHNEH
jgi:uncharacterized protein YdaT